MHGLHTRLNILGKQSNRGSGGEMAIQSCELIETEIGERDTLLREGRLASRAFRDEAFWRSQVNFGPPNPATDEKALWYGVKGSVL
ncbi:hypothetical protein Tco_0509118 [Tanacetum coccineum]